RPRHDHDHVHVRDRDHVDAGRRGPGPDPRRDLLGARAVDVGPPFGLSSLSARPTCWATSRRTSSTEVRMRAATFLLPAAACGGQLVDRSASSSPSTAAIMSPASSTAPHAPAWPWSSTPPSPALAPSAANPVLCSLNSDLSSREVSETSVYRGATST